MLYNKDTKIILSDDFCFFLNINQYLVFFLKKLIEFTFSKRF